MCNMSCTQNNKSTPATARRIHVLAVCPARVTCCVDFLLCSKTHWFARSYCCSSWPLACSLPYLHCILLWPRAYWLTCRYGIFLFFVCVCVDAAQACWILCSKFIFMCPFALHLLVVVWPQTYWLAFSHCILLWICHAAHSAWSHVLLLLSQRAHAIHPGLQDYKAWLRLRQINQHANFGYLPSAARNCPSNWMSNSALTKNYVCIFGLQSNSSMSSVVVHTMTHHQNLKSLWSAMMAKQSCCKNTKRPSNAGMRKQISSTTCAHVKYRTWMTPGCKPPEYAYHKHCVWFCIIVALFSLSLM